MRILAIEDEHTLAGFIEQGLRAEGHAVTVCHDGASGEAAALTGDYALVLLDLTLPGKDGLDVLARDSRTDAGATGDRAHGARGGRAAGRGARPGRERLRDQAVLASRSYWRGCARSCAPPASANPRCSRSAGIRMDLRTRRVERDGHEVELTAREFEVLAYLMRHPDQVLSREQILNAVWGFDFDPGTKVLEVYIGYLRRKLGADTDGSDPIETVRNVGYRLRAPRD